MQKNNLDDRLQRIRTHANSTLANQKKLSDVLLAIEKTLAESSTAPFSETAYFVALLSMLLPLNMKGTDNELLYSVLYLLDLVTVYTPASLLSSKLNNILQILAPILASPEIDPNILKPCIGVIQTLITKCATENDKSGAPTLALNAVLKITLDPRPKVRKRAQDAAVSIATTCPLFTDAIATALLNYLPKSAASKKGSGKADHVALLHTLNLLALVYNDTWSQEHDQKLIDAIIDLLSLDGNIMTLKVKAEDNIKMYLLQAVFNLISSFLKVKAHHKKKFNQKLLTKSKVLIELADEFRGYDESLKSPCNDTIGRAIQSLGPKVVLEVLPLNIDLQEQDDNKPGRGWMLPILRDNVQNTNLSHFLSTFVPLSEKLYQYSIDNQNSKQNSVTIKVVETIVDQIWQLLPAYCNLPIDLDTAFDQGFAELLAGLLYQKSELRSVICKALQALIEKHQARANELSSQHMNQMPSPEQAKRGLLAVGKFSGDFLPILFNIFSETLPQYRSYVLQCIRSFLSITPVDLLQERAEQVLEMLKQECAKGLGNKDGLSTTHNLMDLAVAMAALIPEPSVPAYYSFATNLLSQKEDAALQKKAYKLIVNLDASNPGKRFLVLQIQDEKLPNLLISCTDSTLSAARKNRLLLLKIVFANLPDHSLHFIPSILPEIIICTKETNDKSRTLAYELLVQMAGRMISGGTVVNSKVKGLEDTEMTESKATLSEFFTMTSAGLAAGSAHMVSATITALSRLVFEFKDQATSELLNEISSVVDMFVNSKNHEIARSALGYVKISLIAFPDEQIRSRLAIIIPNLLKWSHEHNGSFKSKVKHMLERAIRRFSYETIEQYMPEEDKKLLANIKKTKDRRKRKKQAITEDQDEAVVDSKSPSHRAKHQSAYEQALADTDEESSEGEGVQESRKGEKKRRREEEYDAMEDDEPLDMLDRKAAMRLEVKDKSSTETTKKRKKTQSRSYETGADGRLIIDDYQEEQGGNDNDDQGDMHNEGAGVVGQNGRIKYKQKRGQTEADASNAGQRKEKATSNVTRAKFNPRSKYEKNANLSKAKGKRKVSSGRTGRKKFKSKA